MSGLILTPKRLQRYNAPSRRTCGVLTALHMDTPTENKQNMVD